MGKIKKQTGFSLIELLIVLGILAGVMSLFSFRSKNGRKDYDRFFRRFSLMSKQIRNQALIEGATYRMVFNVSEDQIPQVWVEKSDKKVLLGSEKESKSAFKDMLEEIKRKKVSTTKKDKDSSSPFTKSSRFNFRKLNPPPGFSVDRMEISGIPEALEKEGLALFHYFPRGQVEQMALLVSSKGQDIQWTLLSDPITGELLIFKGEHRLKELQER